MPGSPPNSPRFGFPRPSDADTASFSTQVLAIGDVLDNAAGPYSSGTLASRPAAGLAGRLYYATDTLEFYWDNGSAWCAGPRPSDRGATSITTTESTGSTSYTTLTTPDQVSGLVLPVNGLIAVWYQAMWQNAAGQGHAAIFLNSTQVQVQGWDASTGHQPLAQGAINPQPALDEPLFSFFGGLGSATSSTAATADVSTGQIVGYANIGGGQINIQIGAQTSMFDYSETSSAGSAAGMAGGPCYIFAAAGTYTVSVQFKTGTAGQNTTAHNRKLWVQAIPFG